MKYSWVSSIWICWIFNLNNKYGCGGVILMTAKCIATGWWKHLYFKRKKVFIYKAAKMASVGNMNNYGHEVTNDKEKKYIIARKQVGKTNSKCSGESGFLQYQQFVSSFKFTVILKSPGFSWILNLDIFYVSQHNCKLKISIFNIAHDLAEGGLYSLKCSKICS